MQLELHKHNEYIHSAQQLHILAYSIENMNQKIKKYLPNDKKLAPANRTL